MEDGPRLRMEYKTTPKWAWPVSLDRISKFWDPNQIKSNQNQINLFQKRQTRK